MLEVLRCSTTFDLHRPWSLNHLDFHGGWRFWSIKNRIYHEISLVLWHLNIFIGCLAFEDFRSLFDIWTGLGIMTTRMMLENPPLLNQQCTHKCVELYIHGIYMVYTWHIKGIWTCHPYGRYIPSKVKMGLFRTFFYNYIPVIYHVYHRDIQGIC